MKSYVQIFVLAVMWFVAFAFFIESRRATRHADDWRTIALSAIELNKTIERQRDEALTAGRELANQRDECWRH